MVSRQALSWAALACGLVASGCSLDRRPPRIVLITVDTLRFDQLLGAPTPPLSRVAALVPEGLAFHQYFSVSASTQPTHATLLTGLYPWEHGVTGNGMRLSDGAVTVAELLAAAGWGTAAAVGSFPVSRQLGFAQGFATFDDRFDQGVIAGEWFFDGDSDGDGDGDADHLYRFAPGVAEAARSALRKLSVGRQFLWIHFYDPHAPYGDTAGSTRTVSPPEILAKAASRDAALALAVDEARELYEADVRALDESLGSLLEELRGDAGFATSIVLVSDHGESFGEQGSLAHGKRLIPSQIHVPLVIWSPRLAPGSRSDVVGSVDVAATLMELAGVELPGARGRDLRREGQDRRTCVFGARRTYRQPFADRRLDGSVVWLSPEPLYFAAFAGRVVRGTGDGLLSEDRAGLSTAEAEWIVARFQDFESSRLRVAGLVEPIEDEHRLSLEALGYVQ